MANLLLPIAYSFGLFLVPEASFRIPLHEPSDDMNTIHEIIDKSTIKSPENTVEVMKKVDTYG
jgi:hypothetical protein